MTAFQITSMKNFMSRLLTSDTFDCFLLEEALIGTANTFHIDGHINRDFFKGKRTPLFFRFVLHLMPEKASALLEKENCSVDSSQVKALVLTIRYDGSKAVLTTGTSFHSFLPSKEPDAIWDRALTRYLSGKGIDFEELTS